MEPMVHHSNIPFSLQEDELKTPRMKQANNQKKKKKQDRGEERKNSIFQWYAQKSLRTIEMKRRNEERTIFMF